MAIRQLSVFVENRPGALTDLIRTLGKEGIDLRALSIADTKDYGILRLIVSDTDKAKSVLQGTGFLCVENTVTAVSVPDEPGGLIRLLTLLGDRGINIEYMYAFVSPRGKNACVVLRVNDTAAASEILSAEGIREIGQDDEL